MASPRHKRLMQESLDEQLSAEARAELHQQLNHDVDSSDEYHRLRQVDRTLRNAPQQRAPRNLALSIMERLAEGIQPIHLSHISGLALAVGLSLVTIIALPLLVGIASSILGAIGSSTALATVLDGVIRLLATIMIMLSEIVQAAQSFIQTTPQALIFLAALLPVGIFFLRRLNNRSATS